jgi:glycosyltransferase involved in cell wall biosynthesis
MADRPRVLFVHISPDMVSFVKKDIEILSRNFEVRPLLYRSRRDIWRVKTGALWADVTFSWFAWDQAAWATRFAKLFHRKSIVVVGGFDVVKMPEISYGNLLHPRPAARTRYAITHADRVIAVSQSLKADAERFSGRHDIEVVYHGFDAEQYTPSGPKDPVVLTVGAVNQSNLKRKGLEWFIKAAAHAPDLSFRLVGRIEPGMLQAIKEMAPPNLQLVGEVDSKTLLAEMRRARVYVQVSAHEGFGCSLAEAMLCGCVPVVSDRGAIPEVVGETGIYVSPGNPHDLADGVRRAFENTQLGDLARERIASLFPLQKRRETLLSLTTELLS